MAPVGPMTPEELVMGFCVLVNILFGPFSSLQLYLKVGHIEVDVSDHHLHPQRPC